MGVIINILDEFKKDCGLIMDFEMITLHLSDRKNEKCGVKKMSK